MNKKDLEGYREQLLQMGRRLQADADGSAAEAFHTNDEMAADNLSNILVEDRAERAANEFRADTAISLAENANAQLEEINAALERIQADNFGICLDCGQEISSDRLNAVPFARQCAACARKAQEGQPAAPGNL